MKSLFTLLFISICFSSLSQETDKIVSITVSGSGKTQDEAKQSALRSAIEQAFGAFISSKTEILNDQVVADQMASVSAGNIQSFTILNESQLPDGSWGVTLKVLVSVNKLTNFVQAKGIKLDFQGALFAINIKQQLLNEQGELKAISEMIGLLHEPMQTSFDYKIKSDGPKQISTDSKLWEIPIEVTANCNKNIDFCANYFIETLRALSLTNTEVESFKLLNKDVFYVKVNYRGIETTYSLRNQTSISAIKSLTSNWEYYTRLFTVYSSIHESNGTGFAKLHTFSNTDNYSRDESDFTYLYFPTNGQQIGIFSYIDSRTLSQIEQIDGYTVVPRGVVTNYKNGGYVIDEKDDHGLVLALFSIGEKEWDEAKIACKSLNLNGYSDWRLPSFKELEMIVNSQIGIINIREFRIGIWSKSSLRARQGNVSILYPFYQVPKGFIDKGDFIIEKYNWREEKGARYIHSKYEKRYNKIFNLFKEHDSAKNNKNLVYAVRNF